MLRTEALFVICGLAAAVGPWFRSEPPPVAPLACDPVVAVVGKDGAERLACLDDDALAACRTVFEGRRYRGCEDAGALRGPVLSMRGQPIDANDASEEDFRALDGVGEGLARRLVEGRREGPYCDANDLGRVSGIGMKRASALGALMNFNHPLCAHGVAQ